ncbi:MAG: DUF427 domain-containing protein [Flavobacteriales bacterium]|nr:DUF427 domain-containing protein [Flavobacteriales bacterium]
MQAIFNGKVIAESDNTKPLEGNHYFPIEDVNKEFLKDSSTHTFCPWKGTASYYTVEVDGAEGTDAAWYYSEPKDAAAGIKDHVAFWKGVEVNPV